LGISKSEYFYCNRHGQLAPSERKRKAQVEANIRQYTMLMPTDNGDNANMPMADPYDVYSPHTMHPPSFTITQVFVLYNTPQD